MWMKVIHSFFGENFSKVLILGRNLRWRVLNSYIRDHCKYVLAKALQDRNEEGKLDH